MSMEILLVDNTPLYREVLKNSLDWISGFSITYASTIAEAKEIIGHKSFQFYVVSWQLSDGEGTELARYIRESGAAPYEPIVLLTSSASAELEEEVIRAGVTELFRKQDVEELVIFIHRFLHIFHTHQCRVLYVEDSLSQRQALKMQMNQWGMQVDDFESAEDAWVALQKNPYDLVICDIVLGGKMSGSRLINRIRRQSGELGNTLILALSAFDSSTRRISLFYLGVDDYVSKPVQPIELRARIHNLLERKRAINLSHKLLKASCLGIFMLRHDGMILSADENASKIFGADRPKFIGKPVAALFSESDENAAQLINTISKKNELIDMTGSGLRNGSTLFTFRYSLIQVEVSSELGSYALLVREISETRHLEN